MKLTLSLVLLLTLMVSGACWSHQKTEKEEWPLAKNEPAERNDTIRLDRATQESIGLQVQAARMTPIASSIFITAVVRPNETRVAHLKPLSRGRVIGVKVRTGDRVCASQALLVYDNIEAGELVAQYPSAVAALDKASAGAEVAKKSLERAEKLVGVGAIARAEVERRSAEHKNSLASVRMAKAEIDKVAEKLRRLGVTDTELDNLVHAPSESANLDHVTVRAPFDGFISASAVAEGEIIDPSQDLLTVTDISTVWLQGDVYERDLGKIRTGQRVDVLTDTYPDEVFRGRITYVSDFLDPRTRTAKVRCEVPNRSGRLKLDMFARVRLPSSDTRVVLVVPEAAVQTTDGKSFVFIRTDQSTFERKEFRTGIRSGQFVEVLGGITEGEMVVTQGSFSLKSALLKDRIRGEER
jgi:cobalt-zinc-cadmium efflux system membrane fusion protein